MTSEEKLENLRTQVRAAEDGLTQIIVCPYCDSELDFSPSYVATHGEVPTCCETFALAIIAILQRVEMQEASKLGERIRQNTGGDKVFIN